MAKSLCIQKLFERLERCFFLLDVPIKRQPGAAPEDIAIFEEATAIKVGDDLKTLWLLSNGSNHQSWFICDPQENRKLMRSLLGEARDAGFFAGSFFTLYSVNESLESWSFFKDVDEQNPDGWSTDSPDALFPQKLDKRIGPQMLRHKRRLPFGTIRGLSDELLLDACPSKKGKYGQILEYSHDPDRIAYVAPSFSAFFERSLYWMEKLLPKDPDKMRALLTDTYYETYS